MASMFDGLILRGTGPSMLNGGNPVGPSMGPTVPSMTTGDDADDWMRMIQGLRGTGLLQDHAAIPTPPAALPTGNGNTNTPTDGATQFLGPNRDAMHFLRQLLGVS